MNNCWKILLDQIEYESLTIHLKLNVRNERKKKINQTMSAIIIASQNRFASNVDSIIDVFILALFAYFKFSIIMKFKIAQS
jgi:hypothetical protein